MLRRKFLKTSSLVSLTLSSVIASCNSETAASDQPVSAPVAGGAGDSKDFKLLETTISDLQEKMKAGSITSKSVCEQYLKRIQDIDKSGPKLNAVIELNPDAIAIAENMDKERKAGKIRGPLHGIPVLIKDNIDTADKMMTTAGALALNGNHAAKDAFIVKQLRAAGAVILGKTNLSEWANFRSSRSTSGWSSRGGQTKMPYIIDRNPSGSSSGSGCAVSANFCTVAVGTETDGSVVSPSSVNGLVGIKPTVGLLSRAGIIPISKTQDTAGPMARTVRDAAILLGVLAGVDSDDAATAASSGKADADYTTFLDINGLKGKRIGIEKSFLKGNDDIVALLNNAIAVLKSKGATIVEVDLLKAITDAAKNEFAVLIYEFKDGVNNYLSKANCSVKSLAEVVQFNKQNIAKAMPFFKQETLELALTKGSLDSAEYKDALTKSHLGSQKVINKMLSENKLDAIAGTTNGLACCIDLANGDYDTGFSFSTPAAIAGYPHITVPMGILHDLPMGLSFFGAPYTEGELIKMGYAYEQATKKRAIPKFINNLVP
jgi:amidase